MAHRLNIRHLRLSSDASKVQTITLIVSKHFSYFSSGLSYKNMRTILTSLILSISFNSYSQDLKLEGTWFECEYNSKSIGDTLFLQRDSCIFNDTINYYLKHWIFKDESQFQQILESPENSIKSTSDWKIRRKKLLITEDLYGGPLTFRYKIIFLSDKKVKLIYLKAF